MKFIGMDEGSVGCCWANNKILCKLSFFVIFIFIFANIFDPINYYGMKYFSVIFAYFFLFLIFFLKGFKAGISTKPIIYIFIFCFLIPFYGLLIYLFRDGGNVLIDRSYISTALLVLFSLFFVFKKNLYYGFISLIVLLRVITALILILVINVIFSLDISMLEFIKRHLMQSGSLYFSERTYGAVNTFYVYFVVSPLLIILLVHDSYRLITKVTTMNFLFFMATCAAVFLVGTRASMILSVIALPFVYFWFTQKKTFFLIIALCIAIFFLAISYEALSEVFDMNENSNATKLSYLKGYADIFASPSVFFLGQGFNAQSWSFTLQDMIGEGLDVGATKTELTYFELIRVFGIFVGGGIILALLYLPFLAFKNSNQYAWFFPAVFMYEVLSFLNPYIFSSNGALVLAFAIGVLIEQGHTQKHSVKGSYNV